MPKNPPGLYRRGPIWHYRFRFRGNEYRGSTARRNREEAAREARRIRAEIESAPPLPDKTVGSTSIWEAHLWHLKTKHGQGLSDIHIDRLEKRWVRVLAFIDEHTPVSAIDEEWLADYVASRRKGVKTSDDVWVFTPVRGQTIRRELQMLRGAMVEAQKRGVLLKLPDKWPRVRSDPPDEKLRGTYYPKHIRDAWFALLHPEARDEAKFIEMTGIRGWGEIKRVRAEWAHPIDYHNPLIVGELVIPASAAKGRRERRVFLFAEAEAILARRSRDGWDPIFSPSDFKKHRARQAEKILGPGKNITLRDLRVSFLSDLAHSTGDPVLVRDVAGHLSLDVTSLYARVTRERMLEGGAKLAGLLGPGTPGGHSENGAEKG